MSDTVQKRDASPTCRYVNRVFSEFPVMLICNIYLPIAYRSFSCFPNHFLVPNFCLHSNVSKRIDEGILGHMKGASFCVPFSCYFTHKTIAIIIKYNDSGRFLWSRTDTSLWSLCEATDFSVHLHTPISPTEYLLFVYSGRNRLNKIYQAIVCESLYLQYI